MINDSRKLKEWGEEDLADAHYLHSHGRKLYKYMQVRISSLNKCAIAKSIELIFNKISFSYMRSKLVGLFCFRFKQSSIV